MPLIYAFVARSATVLADYSVGIDHERRALARSSPRLDPHSRRASFVRPRATPVTSPSSQSRPSRRAARGTTPSLRTAATAIVRRSCSPRVLAPTHALTPRFLLPPLPTAFNYLSSQGYTFLCVADDAYGRAIPFAFLEKVRDEWFAKWADKGASAAAHSLDRSFGARLKYWMEYCETHPDEVSKAAEVQKKVDEVKGIMVENIERVLERGEKIELLVDKTDNLRFQADKFHKTGRTLRNKMWWQNFKVQIIVLLIVILIAVIIFCSVCFSGGNYLK